MGHIGKVISEIRNDRSMSRKDLAEGICSEKYIYFIESGQRTPSAEVVRMLSDRFGEDLFEYYKFMECEEPAKVKNIIDRLAVCQRRHKFAEAQEILKEAEALKDFKSIPWRYIYDANEIGCSIFLHGEFQQSIDNAWEILQSMDEKYRVSVYALSLYMEVSTCNLILGNIEEAKKVARIIEKIVSRFYESTFDHSVISGKINLLTIYFYTQDYDKAVQVGEDVLQFQQESNSYDRIQYTLGFLAFSYYKKEMYEKAFLYFNKALTMILFNHGWCETLELTKEEMFLLMIRDKRVNENLLKEYKSIFRESADK